MRKLLILIGWTVGALILLETGMNSLYGATVRTASRTPVPTNWSNVIPPVVDPSPRTAYRP